MKKYDGIGYVSVLEREGKKIAYEVLYPSGKTLEIFTQGHWHCGFLPGTKESTVGLILQQKTILAGQHMKAGDIFMTRDVSLSTLKTCALLTRPPTTSRNWSRIGENGWTKTKIGLRLSFSMMVIMNRRSKNMPTAGARKERIIRAYSDGGIIGPNPSSAGGTWYYIVTEEEKILDECGGVLRPVDLDPKTKPPVTNNITELYALCSAIIGSWPGIPGAGETRIEDVKPNAHLIVHTDSFVSLSRLQNADASMENVPEWLVCKVRLAQEHLRRFLSFHFVLLQGHPTKSDLEAGIGAKRKLPVSIWNVKCDAGCNRMRLEYEKGEA